MQTAVATYHIEKKKQTHPSFLLPRPCQTEREKCESCRRVGLHWPDWISVHSSPNITALIESFKLLASLYNYGRAVLSTVECCSGLGCLSFSTLFSAKLQETAGLNRREVLIEILSIRIDWLDEKRLIFLCDLAGWGSSLKACSTQGDASIKHFEIGGRSLLHSWIVIWK